MLIVVIPLILFLLRFILEWMMQVLLGGNINPRKEEGRETRFYFEWKRDRRNLKKQIGNDNRNIKIEMQNITVTAVVTRNALYDLKRK